MSGWKTWHTRLIAVVSVALVAAMLAGGLVASLVPPRVAEAVPEDPPPPSLPQVRAGPPDLTLSSLGSGRYNVPGFLDQPPGSFNPLAQEYPTSNPTSGFTATTEYFVGTIRARSSDGTEVLVYCIDIRTPTGIGATYWLGNWDAATVPRVGFVAYILNKYYPETAEPAGLSNDDKAAAVQAAIWYFTDGFVINTSQTTLHAAVAAIVADAKANGPLPAPAPPSLSIAPTTLSGPAGQVLGPFTVTVTGVATQATIEVTPTDVEMFEDAAATRPIARGSTVNSGTTIYLRSSTPKSAVLQATARASVPSGSAYLYTGGADARQKLILAQDSELRTTVSAAASFLADGSLVVTKIIAGEAAQRQEQVVIEVTCNGTLLTPTFVIPAGTVAGMQSRTYTGIPLGAQCTVTETADGSTASVTVTVTGNNQQVQIPPDGGSASAQITDTFEFVTLTPTSTPTGTPTATNTPTTPTETPTPTDTPVPPTPTNTPVPPTNTPVPPTPTNTPVSPTATGTLGPEDVTNTPTPTPPPGTTNTPVPPTNTPVPPTNTPVPPTNTPVPPTATPTLGPAGATDTPMPTRPPATSTPTPAPAATSTPTRTPRPANNNGNDNGDNNNGNDNEPIQPESRTPTVTPTSPAGPAVVPPGPAVPQPPAIGPAGPPEAGSPVPVVPGTPVVGPAVPGQPAQPAPSPSVGVAPVQAPQQIPRGGMLPEMVDEAGDLSPADGIGDADAAAADEHGEDAESAGSP